MTVYLLVQMILSGCSVTFFKTRKATHVKVNIKARSRNHCCRGKAISNKRSECVYLALAIRQASRYLFCAAILYCHVGPVGLSHISHRSHKQQYFRGKTNWLNTKCVVWFPLQLLSETLLILRRIRRHITTYVHRYSHKTSVILKF